MKRTSMITGGILLFAGLFILFIFITMWLWNWLMPMIFELPEITFWQTAGLVILAKIIFSGFGHEHKWHRDYKRRTWHRKFREKFRADAENSGSRFFDRNNDNKNAETE